MPAVVAFPLVPSPQLPSDGVFSSLVNRVAPPHVARQVTGAVHGEQADEDAKIERKSSRSRRSPKRFTASPSKRPLRQKAGAEAGDDAAGTTHPLL